MESQSTSTQLDDAATKRRLRLVDVVRSASVVIVAMAVPWVFWGLIIALYTWMGYPHAPERFPWLAAVVPSIVLGGLFAAGEIRWFNHPAPPSDPSLDAAARRYFNAHYREHLRPEHAQLIRQNPRKHLDLFGVGISTANVEELAGTSLPGRQFEQRVFKIVGIKHPEQLASLLIEMNPGWRSKRLIYAKWYPDGDIKIGAPRSITIRHVSRLPLDAVWPYFTFPGDAGSSWIGGGWGYLEIENDVIHVSVGQDHSFSLRRVDQSPTQIVFDQYGRDGICCRVTVDFDVQSEGTQIAVTFSGVISIYEERELISDWAIQLIQ